MELILHHCKKYVIKAFRLQTQMGVKSLALNANEMSILLRQTNTTSYYIVNALSLRCVISSFHN